MVKNWSRSLCIAGQNSTPTLSHSGSTHKIKTITTAVSFARASILSFSADEHEEANSMPISLSPKQIGLSPSRSCLPSQSIPPIWWHLKEVELGQGKPRGGHRRRRSTGAAREHVDASGAGARRRQRQRHESTSTVAALENNGSGPGEQRRFAACYSMFIIC